jgi:hypothetical protein
MMGTKQRDVDLGSNVSLEELLTSTKIGEPDKQKQ